MPNPAVFNEKMIYAMQITLSIEERAALAEGMSTRNGYYNRANV